MRYRFIASVLTGALLLGACTSTADGADPSVPPPAPDEPTTSTTLVSTGEQPAPQFPDDLDWLNVAEPLSLQGLRGKIVLLDFWTYGCINCIHIIPDLKRLEAEFAEELVVIGVHSAKFTTEGATENVRQIILRYGLEHPVVNDPDFEIWNDYQVAAWPTVFLIDPAGNLLGRHSGENVYDVVQPFVAAMVDDFDERGLIDRTPIEQALESAGLPRTILSFPGKVLAVPELDRVFVADTGNHRIVEVIPATGEATAVYGSGRRGFTDGPALDAELNSPQGMAYSPADGLLYVADTGNHSIRSVNPATGAVATVVGTGSQAATYPPSAGTGPGVELSSPWDLAFHDGLLYIAMAGSHQIWSFDPVTERVGAIIGTGGESTRNGPGAVAELAQPSALVVGDDDRLYFADSESSSIRSSDLGDGDRPTATLAGSDASLFDFGDADGVGTGARFQHPLGIEWLPDTGTLLVADTYNHRIREVDPATGEVTTRFGSAQGWEDGNTPRFFEPGGLSYADGVVYVADTNNHVVRAIDLTTQTVSTFIIEGIQRFTPPPEDDDFGGTFVELETAVTGAGPGSFVLDVTLPPDHKVNEDAPSSVVWAVDGDAVVMSEQANRSLTGARFPVEVTAAFSRGEALVTSDLTVIYCREEAESLCFIEEVRFRIPLRVGDAAISPRISLPYEIQLPDP
jgi:DNA-binding beta-propeller fold protein YncE